MSARRQLHGKPAAITAQVGTHESPTVPSSHVIKDVSQTILYAHQTPDKTRWVHARPPCPLRFGWWYGKLKQIHTMPRCFHLEIFISCRRKYTKGGTYGSSERPEKDVIILSTEQLRSWSSETWNVLFLNHPPALHTALLLGNLKAIFQTVGADSTDCRLVFPPPALNMPMF